MKWLKIVLDFLAWVAPFYNGGKSGIADELEIARIAIQNITKADSAKEKGNIIENAANSLKYVKGYKKRVAKKLDKAKDRLWKKILGD